MKWRCATLTTLSLTRGHKSKEGHYVAARCVTLRGGVVGRLIRQAVCQVSYILYLATVEASKLVIFDGEAEGGREAAGRCPGCGVMESTDRRRTRVTSSLVSGRM